MFNLVPSLELTDYQFRIQRYVEVGAAESFGILESENKRLVFGHIVGAVAKIDGLGGKFNPILCYQYRPGAGLARIAPGRAVGEEATGQRLVTDRICGAMFLRWWHEGDFLGQGAAILDDLPQRLRVGAGKESF